MPVRADRGETWRTVAARFEPALFAHRGVPDRRVPAGTTFGGSPGSRGRVSSNTLGKGCMNAFPILLLAMLAALSGRAHAQALDLSLDQLNHRVFTALNEAPTDISALAQTRDGTFWIGGRTGLTRFDGIRFVGYPGPSEEPLPGTNIASLFSDSSDGLWIGFRPGGAAELKRGRVTRYGEGDGLPDGTVEQFTRDRGGVLWAATRRGLARFNGTRWEK